MVVEGMHYRFRFKCFASADDDDGCCINWGMYVSPRTMPTDLDASSNDVAWLGFGFMN